MSSKEECLQRFEEFVNNTVVELMPNFGTDYDEQIDEDLKAVKDYFDSELFQIIHKRIQ